MARPVYIGTDGITVAGPLKALGGITPAIARTDLLQDNLAVYNIPLTRLVVWDTMQPLPAAGADDDLGLVCGTFASASPTLQADDHDSEGSAQLNYARLQLWLPAEYVDGETVIIRLHAGMLTNVADQAATLDLEAFLVDEEAGIGSDICATTAIGAAFNTVTMADQDFTITAATLSAGSMLDIRITTSVDDDATGAAVIAKIGSVKLLCDIRG